MDLDTALKIFYSSNFGNEKIIKYAIVSNGIVLIGKEKDGLSEGNIYYLVTHDGKVQSTNPILSELNGRKILTIS